MATVLDGTLVDNEKLKDLVESAQNRALTNGVLMRTSGSPESSEVANHAPITLFPSVVPKHLLDQAKGIQKTFNLLMHKVAYDHKFLEQCLQNVIKVDDFTRRLWKIYTKVQEEGPCQSVGLGLFRNDYMMDTKQMEKKTCKLSQIGEYAKLKQIEFNTIASSFAGLVGPLTDVHRYSLCKAKVQHKRNQIPENDPAHGLAMGMVKAWQLYGKQEAAILFVVSMPERNKIDQVWMEKKVTDIDSSIQIVYSSLKMLTVSATLSHSKELLVHNKVIAVVYYREGYSPDHYPSQKEWDVRLLIEKSKAIKCPTVHSQLAGTKKIQQELSRPGAVERFISNDKEVAGVRSLFAGQFSLDLNTDGDRNTEMAIKTPENFVLKPQREGGGNNYYNEELKHILEAEKSSESRAGYILMEKIYPWTQKNYLLKVGEDSSLRQVVSEIGIYGVILGSSDDVKENEVVGHLMRTKSLGVDEGGVATGYSCLDTPFLIS